MNENKKLLYIECACSSEQHVIRFVTYNDGDVLINVQMAPLRFWRRLGNALRYIFRYQSTDWHWQECVVSGDDLSRIADFLLAQGGKVAE
jgi:hypothetical protein